MINLKLFVDFLRVYAFQPATAFWRAVEVDILRKYLPTSGICLDIGCGDGKLTFISFEEIGTSDLIMVGIDGDEGETNRARQSTIYERVHTCWASNIPEPSATFDHVLSNSVLEHIADIEDTLAEIARLLKPGGTFVFTVPSPGFRECLRGPLVGKNSREEYLSSMDKRLAHLRYWSAEEWHANLARCGMVVETNEEYFNCHEVQRWETISRFTAGILYLLSSQKQSPILIQKKLGLRQMQNRMSLPRWMASIIASVLSAFLKRETSKTQNGCLLILARKQA
jgi:ubiquinone/menaquinone biosynthesis C-methylase UbiE